MQTMPVPVAKQQPKTDLQLKDAGLSFGKGPSISTTTYTSTSYACKIPEREKQETPADRRTVFKSINETAENPNLYFSLPTIKPLKSFGYSPPQIPLSQPTLAPSSMTAPFITPTSDQVASSVVSPVTSPVPVPIMSPVMSPVPAPVMSPVMSPVPAPVMSPMLASIISPVLTPVMSPVPAPLMSPVPAPVMFPTPPPASSISSPLPLTSPMSPAQVIEIPVQKSTAPSPTEDMPVDTSEGTVIPIQILPKSKSQTPSTQPSPTPIVPESPAGSCKHHLVEWKLTKCVTNACNTWHELGRCPNLEI